MSLENRLLLDSTNESSLTNFDELKDRYDELTSVWKSQDQSFLRDNYAIYSPTDQVMYCIAGLKELYNKGFVGSVDDLPDERELEKGLSVNLTYIRFDMAPRYFPDEDVFQIGDSVDDYEPRINKGIKQGFFGGVVNDMLFFSSQLLVDGNVDFFSKDRLLASSLMGLVFMASAFYNKKSLGDHVVEIFTD
jgi:hypothetical protein